MKQLHPDNAGHHHKYGYFMRRMEPPLPLRKFSVRPTEPDSPALERYLAAAAAAAIAGYLLWCAVAYMANCNG